MNNEVRIIVAGGRDFNDWDLARKSIHKVLFKIIDKHEGLQKEDVLFISAMQEVLISSVNDTQIIMGID